jgi:hypothetical protein
METKDDLKQIQGIGPGIESRLHKAGVLTYTQLSDLTPEVIHKKVGRLIGISDNLALERISDWIRQARDLAAESEPDNLESEMTTPNERMHYASFKIRLLLDAGDNIRRTQVEHVQSQLKDAWAGWEEVRLEEFISKSTGLSLPIKGERETPETKPAEIVELMPALPARLEAETQVASISGNLRLGKMAVKTAEREDESKVILSDQPFRICLTLNLADLKAPRNVLFGYSALVLAKKIGGGARQVVGSSEGTLLLADNVSVEVKNIQLSNGFYRIEAFVELKPSLKTAKPIAGLKAMTETSLFQVI